MVSFCHDSYVATILPQDSLKKWKRGWNTNNSSDSSSITLNVMSKLKYLVDIHTVLNIGLSTDRM